MDADRTSARSGVDEEAVLFTHRDVYWFVGGPLDGRVHSRPAAEPVPATFRHVHLHDGPKIVSYYDLHEVAGHGGEYRFRGEASVAPQDE